MPPSSKKLFQRWLNINQEQLILHYKNYIDEALHSNDDQVLTDIVGYKQFALDYFKADLIDTQNRHKTLLFDPVPIVTGQVKTKEQLIKYIETI